MFNVVNKLMFTSFTKQTLANSAVRHNYSTIYALSSGFNNPYQSSSKQGVAIAVLRISGPQTNHIIDSLTNGQLCKFKPRHARLINLYNKHNQNDLIDRAIAIWFPKPNSYTGEDMCELHVHGSKAVVKSVLGTLCQFEDTSPAENGEFTKRAFLNQKLSLIEAEAINELVGARCDSQRKNALRGLSGSVIQLYNGWRERLIKLHAYLQAEIEFGEDQLLDEEKIERTIANIFKIKDEISEFLEMSSQRRHIVKDGLNICILGCPNVGKSSLMNGLCDKELSIVSPFQGTTRDVIEHSMEINGYQVHLSDTAGIRSLKESNENYVESQGIRKALERAKSADILVHLIDVSKLSVQSELVKDATLYLNEELERFELEPMSDGESRKTIHVLNKVDLIETSMRKKLDDLFEHLSNIIMLSCETNENLSLLIDLISDNIEQLIRNDNLEQTDDFITERHQNHLKRIVANITLAIETIDEDRCIASYHIENSIKEIACITGTITTEQILDVLFNDFCIGK